jgi:hypothetical protein
MSFARFSRSTGQPNLARSSPADARRRTSDDSDIPRRGRQPSELMVSIRRRFWKAKRRSATDHSSPSQSTPIPVSTAKAENPPTEGRVDALSPPDPAIHLTNVAVIPSPETVPAIGPVKDRLSEAWDAVKDDRRIANMSRSVDADGVS